MLKMKVKDFIILFAVVIFIKWIYTLSFRYSDSLPSINKVIITNSPSKYAPTREQLIPRRIIQTACSNNLDVNLYHTCNQNKHMNPEYEYLFYDNESCESFIQDHFPEYLDDYNSIIPGAFKADLFRYLVLYKLGGVYIDCKSGVIEPLEEFISPTDSLVMVRDLNPNHIYNGIIASVPEHPVIKAFIDQYVQNIRQRYYGDNFLDIGGPSMCGKIWNKLMHGKGPIEFGQYKIDGMNVSINAVVYINKKLDLIRRFDGKVLMSRSTSDYLVRKTIDTITLKDYGLRWYLGKIYRK